MNATENSGRSSPGAEPAAAAPAPAAAARRIAVVTTMHAEGYRRYGREMLVSGLCHLPVDVPIHVYAEGFRVDLEAAHRLVLHDLEAAAPGLMAFKRRHRDDPRLHGRARRRRWHPHWVHASGARRRLRLLQRMRGYRWDAVRFAHKSFAVFDAARRVDADVLVWIDADTRFFAEVPREALEALVPRDCFVGHLRREHLHSECGVVAYNLRHPATRALLADLEAFYTRDLLLREREFHDSWLFDVARRRQERHGHRAHDIALGVGAHARHVLVNSPLGAFMDHMKGDRKDAGRSRPADLVVARAEAYWQPEEEDVKRAA